MALEPLTQVERNLLYQIRTYARFRKEFFVAIAGGGIFSGGVFTPAGVITPTTVSPTADVGKLMAIEARFQLTDQQDHEHYAVLIDRARHQIARRTALYREIAARVAP